jgi:hypothetical protein
MFFKCSTITGLFVVGVASAFPGVSPAQTEGLPAIAREVYRPHTELPPAPAPRVVTERLVTEPPIVPPRVVDDTPVVSRAVVQSSAVVVTPASPIPAVAVAGPSIFSRYSFGFYNDGNADDNWYYDYYEAPKTAATVVVKPPTDSAPGFRTNWTYAPLAERGLFSW